MSLLGSNRWLFFSVYISDFARIHISQIRLRAWTPAEYRQSVVAKTAFAFVFSKMIDKLYMCKRKLSKVWNTMEAQQHRRVKTQRMAQLHSAVYRQTHNRNVTLWSFRDIQVWFDRSILLYLQSSHLSETTDGWSDSGSSSSAQWISATSNWLLACTASPDTDNGTSDGILTAEWAVILGVLGDFNLLDLLTEWGTITSTILTNNSDLLSTTTLFDWSNKWNDCQNNAQTIYKDVRVDSAWILSDRADDNPAAMWLADRYMKDPLIDNVVYGLIDCLIEVIQNGGWEGLIQHNAVSFITTIVSSWDART